MCLPFSSESRLRNMSFALSYASFFAMGLAANTGSSVLQSSAVTSVSSKRRVCNALLI